ncbi:hypothetical protein B0H11DRAFT_1252212 [Mycena galericulata]|nr:hypothetical protein B0H11DRAFT_1252212 [Mycena galericulata]
MVVPALLLSIESASLAQAIDPTGMCPLRMDIAYPCDCRLQEDACLVLSFSQALDHQPATTSRFACFCCPLPIQGPCLCICQCRLLHIYALPVSAIHLLAFSCASGSLSLINSALSAYYIESAPRFLLLPRAPFQALIEFEIQNREHPIHTYSVFHVHASLGEPRGLRFPWPPLSGRRGAAVPGLC